MNLASSGVARTIISESICALRVLEPSPDCTASSSSVACTSLSVSGAPPAGGSPRLSTDTMPRSPTCVSSALSVATGVPDASESAERMSASPIPSLDGRMPGESWSEVSATHRVISLGASRQARSRSFAISSSFASRASACSIESSVCASSAAHGTLVREEVACRSHSIRVLLPSATARVRTLIDPGYTGLPAVRVDVRAAVRASCGEEGSRTIAGRIE
eukprot:scaffold83105_cov67-Phaeocystis_antarctica.AAC.2